MEVFFLLGGGTMKKLLTPCKQTEMAFVELLTAKYNKIVAKEENQPANNHAPAL